MGYRLKQENFNKPVTAEAIKVLRVIAVHNPLLDTMQLPYVSPLGVIGEGGAPYNYARNHGQRRCHRDTCFCALTRLQANILIRYSIRGNPAKKAALREWRVLRADERRRRRFRTILNVIPTMDAPGVAHIAVRLSPADPMQDVNTIYGVRYQPEEDTNA